MYDSAKIITGLVIFFGVATLPFWLGSRASTKSPHRQPVVVQGGAKNCIMPKQFMRAQHMVLLDKWRDTVVRKGKRYTTLVYKKGAKPKRHLMSLTNNCMKCHQQKKFCLERCHNYVGVSTYCWDCHVERKGK